jgi:AmmeMemoRadiSam system protein A
MDMNMKGGAKMVPDQLSPEEKKYLLDLARQSLEKGVCGQELPVIKAETLTPRLRAHGASFVTLTHLGNLRGCIGALEPYQPLAEDVREHAVAAALDDYRFSPVQPAELPDIKIEISRLTVSVPLAYNQPEDLPQLLRPGIDGVILRDGIRRATFLPQVWEKIADANMFLSQLCIKMGASPDAWRKRKISVETYQVEEFHE